MKFIKRFIILFIIFSLTACAPQSRRMENLEVEEKFVPYITETGLKIFIYTVSMKGAGEQGDSRGGAKSTGERGGSRRGTKPTGGRGGGSHGGTTPDRDSMEKSIKEKIEQKLLAKLTETGYCREGYLELGSSIGKRESSIRGECKEGATEEDRQVFLSET
jgi:hypothetical protein